MNKILKSVIGVFAAIGAAYIALLLFVSFGIRPEKSCTVYPVMSVSSPDGKFSAEQHQETCNHESQTVTSVVLKKNETLGLGGGNQWGVFRAPSSRRISKQPETYEPLLLQIAWLSSMELQISYPQGTITSTTQGDFDGITVRYKEITFDR